MKKKLLKIIILLILIAIVGFMIFRKWQNGQTGVDEKTIVGSFEYKTTCTADTMKGENGVSQDTLVLKKDKTFTLEQDSCFGYTTLEGEYSLDEKTNTLFLQNEMASYAETMEVKDKNTIIRRDEVDREIVYKRKK